MRRVVLDTNVLVAALRSTRGASFRLLSLVGTGAFEIALSVALVLEYEDALLRHLAGSPFDEDELAELLDYLCTVAHRQEIFYLWRRRCFATRPTTWCWSSPWPPARRSS